MDYRKQLLIRKILAAMKRQLIEASLDELRSIHISVTEREKRRSE